MLLAAGAYDVINGNTVPEGGLVTGNTAPEANALDRTVTPVPLGDKINQHASFINNNLLGAG